MTRYITWALVIALLSLAPFSFVGASETTSGDYGEGYVGMSEGTMCFEPVPDDDTDTLAFTLVDFAWLHYGDYVTIYEYQPEMYFGWLYIIVNGSGCLVAQGTIDTENPLGTTDDLIVEDTPVVDYVPIAPEPPMEPTPESPAYEANVAPDPPSVSNAVPTSTHTTGDQIVGLPSTGSGIYGGPEDPKEWLTLFGIFIGIVIAASTFVALAIASLARYLDRRDEIDPKIKRASQEILFWIYLCPVGLIIIIADCRKKKHKERRRIATT